MEEIGGEGSQVWQHAQRVPVESVDDSARRTLHATNKQVYYGSSGADCSGSSSCYENSSGLVIHIAQQRPKEPKIVQTIMITKWALVPFISSVSDLVSLSQTCYGLSLQLRNSTFIKTILIQNLSRLLTRFNFTVGTLNNIFQLHQGTILSGSTILQAYMGNVYSKYDLDFYIPLRTEAETFLRRYIRVQIGRHKEYLLRDIPPILEYFGLPPGSYRSARLIVSKYFPEHFGFVLELIQDVQYVLRSSRIKSR